MNSSFSAFRVFTFLRLILPGSGCRWRGLLVAFLFALPPFQDKGFSQLPSSLKISFYGDKSGLPNQSIFCIEQDHLGYIWIGTKNGLFRFDGTNYLPFYENCDPAKGIPGGTVLAIDEDEDNRLWVGTTGGLCWINTEDYTIHWFEHPALINNQVNSLEIEGNKHLWVGRVDSIYVIDLVNFNTVGFQARHPDERWGLNFTEDLLLYKDSLLLACGAGAITQIDIHSYSVNRILSGKGANLCMVPYQSNQLIVSNYFKDAFVFNMSTHLTEPLILGHINQKFKHPNDVFFSIIHKTLNDHVSFYLAAGQSGIVCIQEEPLQYGKSYDCVSGESHIEHPVPVYKFIESRDGNIWGAASNGFFKIDFQHQYFNSHPVGRILDVYSDPFEKNILWIIRFNGEVCAYDINKDTTLLAYSIIGKKKTGMEEQVSTSFQDSAFQIWLGTDLGNVYLFDLKTRTSRVFHVRESLPGQVVKISGISTVSPNEIWLVSNLGVIKMQVEPEVRCELFSDELIVGPDKELFAVGISHDSKGRLWIFPSLKNPVLFDPNRSAFKEVPVINCLGQEFNPPRTGGLCETHDHQVWLVCNNTPCLLNEEKLNFESQDFGFDNMELESMIWRPDGSLFAAMADRLCIWHPANADLQTFSRQEGWPSTDCFWMGPLKGKTALAALDNAANVVLFEPEELKQLPCNSPILLTEFQILNKHKSLNPVRLKKAGMDYDENNIRFTFQVLNYANPALTNYSFMLEGMDNTWNFGQQSNSAIYTNLPDGHFTFWVKAKTSGESWSVPIALADFTIATPFWRMIWFRVLVLSFLAGSIYSFYQYRVSNLKRMLRVRTKISSDLHDDIGSTLTSIRVYSDLAKQQSDDQKLKGILNKIEENAADMIQSMSDIVWMINPKYDDFTFVIQRMENFASNFLSLKEIQYSISKENKVEELRLDMEKRKNLFLIFKEALHNAAKHSGCHHVSVRLINQGKALEMHIQDDGRGFNGSSASIGNGLSNMTGRAAEVGGSFKVESRPGQGTSIVVSIPL